MTAPAKITLSIFGMGCDGCVSVIENAVMAMPGIAYVGVSLSGGTMTIRPSGDIDVQSIVKSVVALGYAVEGKGRQGSAYSASCPCRQR